MKAAEHTAQVPPQIDLANEDLVSSHIHAIWLAETGQSLGHTLADVLDLDDHERLDLREAVAYALNERRVVLAAGTVPGACWG